MEEKNILVPIDEHYAKCLDLWPNNCDREYENQVKVEVKITKDWTDGQLIYINDVECGKPIFLRAWRKWNDVIETEQYCHTYERYSTEFFTSHMIGVAVRGIVEINAISQYR